MWRVIQTVGAPITPAPFIAAFSSVELANAFAASRFCNQVIDEQHVLAALNPVGVQLKPVGAVLEVVVVTEVFGRELPLFADRHEADIQPVSERGADNKAARFDCRDLVDWAPAIRRTEFLDDRVKAIRVFEQCRDVAKQNARLGKVGDSPDLRLDVDVLRHCDRSQPNMVSPRPAPMTGYFLN